MKGGVQGNKLHLTLLIDLIQLILRRKRNHVKNVKGDIYVRHSLFTNLNGLWLTGSNRN